MESVCTGNRTKGSNPFLSAIHFGFAFIHGVEKGFSGAPSRFALGLTASNPFLSATCESSTREGCRAEAARESAFAASGPSISGTNKLLDDLKNT